MLWTLVRKDLVQHVKPLLFLALGALAFPLLATLRPGSRMSTAAYVGFVFGLLGFSGPILLAMTFIGQEKVKGTLRFLRLMPISGRRIITAKCLSSMGILLVLLNLAVALEPWLLGLGGVKVAHISLTFVLWLNVLTLFFAALDGFIFTLFRNAVAAQIAYWSLALLLVGVTISDQYLEARGIDVAGITEMLLRHYGLKYWGGIPFLLVAALLVRMAGHIFEQRDWSDLEEE